MLTYAFKAKKVMKSIRSLHCDQMFFLCDAFVWLSFQALFIVGSSEDDSAIIYFNIEPVITWQKKKPPLTVSKKSDLVNWHNVFMS